MDLIASLYFSSGIWTMISLGKESCYGNLFKTTLKAGALGCFFLALIYFGLTKAAAVHSQELKNVDPEKLMTILAGITLGPNLAIVANIAVALACLTTVVSLCTTITNILINELLIGKISYHGSIFGMLAITFLMSNFGFGTIMKIIHPAVSFCYPFIILLTIVNIYKKLKRSVVII